MTAISSRTVIVTGGSRGIGLAIARGILEEGGRAMIVSRDGEAVEHALARLRAAASAERVAGVAADVRRRAGCDALIAYTMETFGGFDTLVNNAAIGMHREIESMTDDEWTRVIETNLSGVFYCTRAAIPRLRAAGGGWIINIASLAARHPFAKGAAYCASKAGLLAFSEALMQELRVDGIRVSCVLPGSVATEFSGHAVTEADSWKLSPDDVARVVIDLLRHPARSLPSAVEMRPARTRALG